MSGIMGRERERKRDRERGREGERARQWLVVCPYMKELIVLWESSLKSQLDIVHFIPRILYAHIHIYMHKYIYIIYKNMYV